MDKILLVPLRVYPVERELRPCDVVFRVYGYHRARPLDFAKFQFCICLWPPKWAVPDSQLCPFSHLQNGHNNNSTGLVGIIKGLKVLRTLPVK